MAVPAASAAVAEATAKSTSPSSSPRTVAPVGRLARVRVPSTPAVRPVQVSTGLVFTSAVALFVPSETLTLWVPVRRAPGAKTTRPPEKVPSAAIVGAVDQVAGSSSTVTVVVAPGVNDWPARVRVTCAAAAPRPPLAAVAVSLAAAGASTTVNGSDTLRGWSPGLSEPVSSRTLCVVPAAQAAAV